MWPFSTIARLKRALTDAYAESDRHEADRDEMAIALNIATEQRESLRRELAEYRGRWTALNENFELLEAASKKLKSENAKFAKSNETLAKEVSDLRIQLADTEAVVADLRGQLAKAQKNDKKDPKTGRFVKA
jgi:chromosome segregation ATPase